MKLAPIALGAMSALLTGCMIPDFSDQATVELIRKIARCTVMYPEIESYVLDWRGRMTVRYRDGTEVVTRPDRFPECGLQGG